MAQMPDNGGTRSSADSQGIRETLLTVTYAGRPEHTPEAENVLVRWQPGTDRVEAEDHDGGVSVYSRAELLAALGAGVSAANLRAA